MENLQKYRFGQMQNLQILIQTNAELTKIVSYSDKCMRPGERSFNVRN